MNKKQNKIKTKPFHFYTKSIQKRRKKQ